MSPSTGTQSREALLVALIAGVLVLLAGVTVAVLVNLDEEPDDVDCIQVVDDVLEVIDERGDTARRVLRTLDDPDVLDQCGPVVNRAIDLTGPAGGPTTTSPSPSTSGP